MADGRRAQLVIAGLCAAGFTIALAALVTSQLALMSVLDATRAEQAARQIAESRFTADIVEQTAETTRIIALLVMFALGFIAVVVHPDPARSLRSMGAAIAVVCGAWLAGLLVAGATARRA